MASLGSLGLDPGLARAPDDAILKRGLLGLFQGDPGFLISRHLASNKASPALPPHVDAGRLPTSKGTIPDIGGRLRTAAEAVMAVTPHITP